jgi:hypothetical protein
VWRICRQVVANPTSQMPYVRKPVHLPPYDRLLGWLAIVPLFAAVFFAAGSRSEGMWILLGFILVVGVCSLGPIALHNRGVADRQVHD